MSEQYVFHLESALQNLFCAATALEVNDPQSLPPFLDLIAQDLRLEGLVILERVGEGFCQLAASQALGADTAYEKPTHYFSKMECEAFSSHLKCNPSGMFGDMSTQEALAASVSVPVPDPAFTPRSSQEESCRVFTSLGLLETPLRAEVLTSGGVDVGFLIAVDREVSRKVTRAEQLYLHSARQSLCEMLKSRAACRTQDRFAQALAVKEEAFAGFMALAAHDLQGVVRKVFQSGEMLDLDGRDHLNEENLFFLDILLESTGTLRQLITDILQYTTRSSVTGARQSVALETVCDRVWTALDAQASNAEITIDKLPIIEADTAQTDILFKAILDNGLKFTADGSPAKIDVRARYDAEQVHIDFCDFGIGIKPSLSVDIFDPLTRLNPKSAYAGSGLGLALARSVCKNQGWEIDYNVDAPCGSIFTVSIPKRDLR